MSRIAPALLGAALSCKCGFGLDARRIGHNPGLAAAASPPPLPDKAPLTEKVWLHIEMVVAPHISRWVAAMQGDGAHLPVPSLEIVAIPTL